MQGSSWITEDILITVRAAPNPSKTYTETSCVAGVRLSDMTPIRIYPVPARELKHENRFKKYDVVRADLLRSRNDFRHESYKVNFESIKFIRHIDTRRGNLPSWADRNQLVEPFRCATSIEQLKRLQTEQGVGNAPSLALIRPKSIERFRIEPTQEEDWSPSQLATLQQLGMFGQRETNPLEYIPFDFKYDFHCDDPACTGHKLSVIDWEVTESYRKWRRQYGEQDWRKAMMTKYWDQLALNRDLQFYVGTIQKHPTTWTIIGLYYPPRQLQMPGLDI